MHNLLNTTFTARVENVKLARTIGIGFLVDLDLQINFLNEIKTVISEAVTNAIVHGCLSDDTKVVSMNLSYDCENVYIEVIDEGVGIENVAKAMEPLFTTKFEEERAGLGFTIMEVFADKLEVKSELNKGTRVLMVKKYTENNEVY